MEESGMIQKIRIWQDKISGYLAKWIGKYLPDKADKTVKIQKQIRGACRGIAGGIAAFFFTRATAFGGSTPFGLALLTAADGRAPYLFAGILLSSVIGQANGITAVASTLIFILRLLVGLLLGGRKAPLFREPLALRLAIGSIGGFVVGIYSIFAGGFAKEQLWLALFLIGTVPLFAYLYEGAALPREETAPRREAGILAYLYTGILTCTSFTFFGYSPALTVAAFATLVLSATGGSLRGGLAGMIGGFACGAVFSPVLGMVGVLVGKGKKRGLSVSVLSAGAIAATVSLAIDGILSLLAIVPAYTIAAALFLPLVKGGWLTRLSPFSAEAAIPGTTAERALVTQQREEDIKRRLSSLSEAMSSLSTVFYALSNRLMTPGTHELREICENAFRGYCTHCRDNTRCWGECYDRTADVMNRLAAAVVRHGNADSSYIPADFLSHCPHAAKAISEINISHARLLEHAVVRNKTEIFAFDYEAMADLLVGATEESAAEYQPDSTASEAVRQAARAMGFAVNNIAVYGKRRKTVLAGGIELSQTKHTAEEIRRALSEACQCRLSIPTFTVDGDYVTMTAAAERTFSCETARASVRKEEEKLNGDSAVVFENRDDRFYALLSDGMGSGRDAAITSRMTCIILEKLLSAGNRKNTVLKILNHFIRNKNVECFATVDLLEIDLLNGEASFVKSGAAASYVLREGKLFKIASQSLPIGITREITAEEIRFSLKENDLVVMISDGVSQSYEDGLWLLDLLSHHIDPNGTLSGIAKTVLHEAAKNNARSDDMTVTVLRMHAA
ncbi:MAG: hypothetical protein E7618_06970 [Ruminococcaceae bacterium]|nr:hypothetical protein [Oscillospiraceae bacterium]